MSESESDTDGGNHAILVARVGAMTKKCDELSVRVSSLQQENRVLKMELETYKLRCKALQEENKALRQESVNIQARAEQEEEFISNTLMKKIHELKKEKETLVNKYETEEEFLTNELQKQLNQLRQDKVELEQTLEKEQEKQVNSLMRKIDKLKRETQNKQYKLEELRREKVELENTLEKEQEGLVNRLWKKMDKLETEKRLLQEKLNQPISAPPSPRDSTVVDEELSENLAAHVRYLKKEVEWLRRQLKSMQEEKNCATNMLLTEEFKLREENIRLQKQLALERERREALSRQLSESESSLEMDEESRLSLDTPGASFMGGGLVPPGSGGASSSSAVRPRTVSSPIPYSMQTARPISPGLGAIATSSGQGMLAFTPPSPLSRSSTMSAAVQSSSKSHSGQVANRFVKPSPPPSPKSKMHEG
ncbi:coiled-coil domain-containing protein 6-like [Styela clava]|uniref:coiled-coil domain-containing protein 6-like n=1 Tax=Styela clava TaxID=7725 RepID=UPI00193A2139|nr:coiled-coil domain-containing protein 6-like [Styela clava]